MAHDHAETQATDNDLDGPTLSPRYLPVFRVNRSTGAYDSSTATANVSTTSTAEIDFNGNPGLDSSVDIYYISKLK